MKNNYIMVACDLHDESMVLRIAHNDKPASTARYETDKEARQEMIRDLRKMSRETKGAKIVFAYEACAQGFGLYDDITEAGFTCYVLAPTKMKRSQKRRKQKNDEKDAQEILEILRGHLFGGNEMPAVWVPDPQLRDDREVVRGRLDVADKVVKVQAQLKGLLKRNKVRKPKDLGKGWTKKFDAWLCSLIDDEGTQLGTGGRIALRSLVEQRNSLEKELKRMDLGISMLASSERYKILVRELLMLKGVGLLTAMVFLTELGDPNRFSNRREVAAYFGLVPSSNETGKTNDRKGHITRQGNPRVRKVLGQAVWSRVRTDENERAWYQGVVARNPKCKKIAIVGSMRRLAILMWHITQRTTAQMANGQGHTNSNGNGNGKGRLCNERDNGNGKVNGKKVKATLVSKGSTL